MTGSFLQDFGLYVHHGNNPSGAIRAYTNAEAGALDTWVLGGGRFLYIGHRSQNDCDIADSLPAGFGLTCTPNNINWSGSASFGASHPTNSLTTIGGKNGDEFSAQAPLEVLASINGHPFVLAAEYGYGKVVILNNEFAFYNTGYTYDISYGDHDILIEYLELVVGIITLVSDGMRKINQW